MVTPQFSPNGHIKEYELILMMKMYMYTIYMYDIIPHYIIIKPKNLRAHTADLEDNIL